MYDNRVYDAPDLTVYLDITDDVKFAWKAQRDIAERGATMEEVQAAIDARKPDFSAYVEPQKERLTSSSRCSCRRSCRTARASTSRSSSSRRTTARSSTART